MRPGRSRVLSPRRPAIARKWSPVPPPRLKRIGNRRERRRRRLASPPPGAVAGSWPRSLKNPRPDGKKNLKGGALARIWGSPNSHVPVAACQSVGIRTRGRTAARDGKRMEGDGHPLKSRSRLSQEGRSRTATGSRRRNRRTPNLHGGRSLKQRRSGLFWSRWSSKGQHRRGLSFIAGRAGLISQSTVFRVRTFRP